MKVHILAFAIGILVLSGAASVFAQDTTFENPLKYESIADIVQGVAQVLFWLAAALVPLLIIIGAFYILTSGGDQARVSTGKKFIVYAVAGFLIALFAQGIIGLIKGVIGVQ